MALAGVMGAFAEASRKTRPKLCGRTVGESTVERTTERAGADIGAWQGAGKTFGEAKPWTWAKDSERKTVADVSADLTGVGMRGANGAEGRMTAVGMVGNAGQPGQVRYVCGRTGGLDVLGDPRRRQAGQVGMDAAQRWVAISDGGSGLEDGLRVNFPRVEAVILAGPVPNLVSGRWG